MSRLHVVFEVLREHSVNRREVYWERIQTLLAQRPVESLNVCVVIGLPHSRVSMSDLYPVSEVRAELSTVISLHAPEEKRRSYLSLFNKQAGGTAIDFLVAPGIGPPGIHVDAGEHIQYGLALDSQMYRINLH